MQAKNGGSRLFGKTFKRNDKPSHAGTVVFLSIVQTPNGVYDDQSRSLGEGGQVIQ